MMLGLPFRNAFEILSRIGLGGMFVYAALAKINAPNEFSDMVAAYKLLPEVVTGLFALVLPMVELLVGLVLMFTVWVRESALLISVMLVLFTAALGQALARGLTISCGCFIASADAIRADMYKAFFRDIALLIPSVWLMGRRNGSIISLMGMREAEKRIARGDETESS